MIWKGDLRPEQRPGIRETAWGVARLLGPVGCSGLIVWLVIGVLLIWGVA